MARQALPPAAPASAAAAAPQGSTSTGSTSSTSINPPEPHRMRITSGGSIASYVQFALRFLTENPKIPPVPLVLHTLPPAPVPEGEGQAVAGPSKAKSKSNSTLSACTLTAPKLISIVEIIKREYVALAQKEAQRGQTVAVAPSSSDLSREREDGQVGHDGKSGELQGKRKGKGKDKVVLQSRGLWQYTESGLWVPAPAPASASAGDGQDLTRVLDGKTKPRMSHHPYLQITLSTQPLCSLENQHGITSQYIAIKKKSKKKKRGKKATGVGAGAEPGAKEGAVAASHDQNGGDRAGAMIEDGPGTTTGREAEVEKTEGGGGGGKRKDFVGGAARGKEKKRRVVDR